MRNSKYADRIGRWSQVGKQPIFPLDPRVEDIDIENIAHCLAHENRYGGAAGAYSVAAHCIIASYMAEDFYSEWKVEGITKREFSLQALLHDAEEFAIKDIPTPQRSFLKVHYPDGTVISHQELGNRWFRTIMKAFGLPQEMHPLINKIDADMLATEAAVFFPIDDRPMDWTIKGEDRIQYSDLILEARQAYRSYNFAFSPYAFMKRFSVLLSS